MNDDGDHEAILRAFDSRRSDQREEAVRDAARDVHADELLSQMLESSRDAVYEKVVIAACLGDVGGPAGDAALRRAARATGPRTRDLRCVSLLALARRNGVLATDDLRVGLTTSDATVKDYAVIGLAGAGDDRAWDEVFAYLRTVLRRKRRTLGQSEVAVALAYLARHVAEASRRTELVTFVRQHWNAIDEDEWFAGLWPEAAPGGPRPDEVPAPDGEAIRAWAREPMFESPDDPWL